MGGFFGGGGWWVVMSAGLRPLRQSAACIVDQDGSRTGLLADDQPIVCCVTAAQSIPLPP